MASSWKPISRWPPVTRRHSRVAIALLGDGHTLPERNVPRDFLGFVFGRWVIPSSIWIFLPVDLDRVITCIPFAWAMRGRGTGFKEILVDRLWREIMISLVHNGAVRFCDHLFVPECFHDGCCSMVSGCRHFPAVSLRLCRPARQSMSGFS